MPAVVKFCEVSPESYKVTTAPAACLVPEISSGDRKEVCVGVSSRREAERGVTHPPILLPSSAPGPVSSHSFGLDDSF